MVCVGTTEIADATTNELAVRSGHVEGVSVSTGLVAGHAYPVPGRNLGPMADDNPSKPYYLLEIMSFQD